MAADFWEHAVESYLCRNRGVFLHPHYLVGEDTRPDFLALDFPRGTVWMVEVTKAQEHKLTICFDKFESRHAPAIRRQLEADGIVRGEAPWRIGLWGFAPRSSLAMLRSRAAQAGVATSDFTPLEEVVTTMAAHDFGDKVAPKP